MRFRTEIKHALLLTQMLLQRNWCSRAGLAMLLRLMRAPATAPPWSQQMRTFKHARQLGGSTTAAPPILCRCKHWSSVSASAHTGFPTPTSKTPLLTLSSSSSPLPEPAGPAPLGLRRWPPREGRRGGLPGPAAPPPLLLEETLLWRRLIWMGSKMRLLSRHEKECP